MAATNAPGEDKAWEILSGMKPDLVCKGASATYDPSSATYTIRCFGMEFKVCAGDRTIASESPGSDVLLGKLSYFFRLSLLWYMVGAREVSCTGALASLQSLKGGDIFTRGSHVLPLEPVAQKYRADKKGFLEKGISLAGESVPLGDASLRLYPLPRVPVVVVLWLEDEEFPARADLLFDSTCQLQIPTDIIWSVAMMSLLVML